MSFRASAALAAALLAAPAYASGEPQESFVYQNLTQALEVLDRAAAAHGGAGLIDRSVSVRFTFTGTYRAEGHYARPWAHRDNPFHGSTVYSDKLRAAKTEGEHEEAKPQPYFTIAGESNGVRLEPGGAKAEAIEEADAADVLRGELEVLPHEYLRQARAGAAGLRLLKGAKGFDVLTYTLPNGENRALYLASDTHLLMRVERLDHWTHKGDRLEWRTFTGYVDRGGIKIPLRSEVHIEGGSTQRNITTEITKLETGVAVGADEFKADAWTLAPPKADDRAEPLAAHDLGNGAYVIELPPSDSRALLVAFSDFSVIVEAGDRSELAARVLATVDKLLPGKPLRYVAVTHHHPLYINGLRPYVERGVTVLATAGNVAYFRELATRPYRIAPDAQQRRPREPKIEVIEGTKIIEDATQRLELHPFDYSTHVDEFVVPYLPSHKLIVSGDLVYVMRGAEPAAASGREKAIHRLVTERGLAVESIMQTWFLGEADHRTPFSTLEEKVRIAAAKAP